MAHMGEGSRVTKASRPVHRYASDAGAGSCCRAEPSGSGSPKAAPTAFARVEVRACAAATEEIHRMTGVRSRLRSVAAASSVEVAVLLLPLPLLFDKDGGTVVSGSDDRATTLPLLGSTKMHPTRSPARLAASTASRM